MGRAGTGIAWDENHVVTANHLVAGSGRVEIIAGGREMAGSVVGRKAGRDIALVKVEGSLTPIGISADSPPRVGQFVLALANPYGGGVGVTSGIIAGTGQRVGGWWNFSVDDAIVTDARVNPGYSGGPLVSASGKLVGMNVARIASRGIAIPSGMIGKAVDRIESGRREERPYLGLLLNRVEIEFDGRERSGFVILSVEKGGPADAAGLKVGDIILSAGERSAGEVRMPGSLLPDGSTGKKLSLGLLRGGSYTVVETVPGGREVVD